MGDFLPVAADPYSWPFDGAWSATDTALLLLGFEAATIVGLGAEVALGQALQLADAAHAAGIVVIASVHAGVGSPPAGFAADCVIEHAGDNAFFRTPLEAELRRLGIRYLVVAGLPTEGLLHATQRTANDMGFECLAVSDASAGTTPERHLAQLRITTFGNGLFGAVADTAAFIAAGRSA